MVGGDYSSLLPAMSQGRSGLGQSIAQVDGSAIYVLTAYQVG